MKSIILFVIAALLLNQPLLACSADGKSGIAPENKEWLPVGYSNPFKKTEDKIDEVKFNKIIDDVESYYAPIVASLGGKLQVVRKWTDGTVNAYANREGNTWFVTMFGGLARHEAITPDGFALVVCHELGHHVGGYPYKRDLMGNVRWASNEGQSDYFATSKCFKHVYGNKNNSAIFFKKLNPTFEASCSKAYKSQKDVALCLRAAVGGQSLANLLAALGKSPMPNVDTPSAKTVTTHDDNHPAAQCRLDTYFQGSLCEKGILSTSGTANHTEGYCVREEGATYGVRPLCWFSEAQAKREKNSIW